RIVRSVTPIISAASHHFNFPAIAFKITSCIFIIRSISAVGICPSVFSTPPSFPHPLLQADISLANSTGQLTCYRQERSDLPRSDVDHVIECVPCIGDSAHALPFLPHLRARYSAKPNQQSPPRRQPRHRG